MSAQETYKVCYSGAMSATGVYSSGLTEAEALRDWRDLERRYGHCGAVIYRERDDALMAVYDGELEEVA